MPGMEFKVIQIESKSGKAALLLTDTGVNQGIPAEVVLPVVVALGNLFSNFKSSNRTTAGTTTITEPGAGGSIQVLDMLISAEKKNGGAVTVRFNDGTNIVSMFRADLTDAPANIAASFAGRWQGWKDARLEMVTASTENATVAVSYLKRPQSLEFAEWDAFR